MTSYWMFIFLLSIYLPSATGECNNCTCIHHNFTPAIKAIGRPPAVFNITWLCETGSLINKVHFNKTSLVNHCQYPTKDALYTAHHCTQISTKTGTLLGCDLAEDIKELNIRSGIVDNLCVMISMTSQTSNETCYFLPKEYNTFFDYQLVCPSPEKFQVLSLKPGRLTVMWNVSPKYVGKEALKDIHFTISYKSNTSSHQIDSEDIKISSYENNTYEIENLRPFHQYTVTICCFFFPPASACNPNHISDPFYVTTVEEAPSSAPLIEDYNILSIENKNFLLVKWKASERSNWNGIVIKYEINYWKKIHGNSCESINNATVLKYKTNGVDRQAKIPDVLHYVSYCFCLRACTKPGCGPWSSIRSVSENKVPNTKGNTSTSSKKDLETIWIILAVGLGILIMIILLVIVLVRKKKRLTRSRLEDTVGSLDTFSSTESTELNSSREDNEYADA